MEECRDLALAAVCQCTPTKRSACRSWRKKKKNRSKRKASLCPAVPLPTKHFPSVGRTTTSLKRRPRVPQAPPHCWTIHRAKTTAALWMLCRPLCPSCRPSRPPPWEAPSLALSPTTSRTTPSSSALSPAMVLSSPLLLVSPLSTPPRAPPSPSAASSLCQCLPPQPPHPASSARARSLWRLHRLQLHFLRLRRSSQLPPLLPARRDEACAPGPTCASTKVSSTSALTGATS